MSEVQSQPFCCEKRKNLRILSSKQFDNNDGIMIVSAANKLAEDLFEDDAAELSDLKVPKGDLVGYHSIRINIQW